ncbi:class I SAM-dependent methyltransferase [Neobacillus cucumis]|uniref:class I SAM-dependent methyltransferase n=1 Tax=Neobacillus cucumis TaxID=1740721 RepID=UPI0028535C2C|nr:class I SAM-dependent methyltransferase [Neobacillus cucumis]MDR4948049.1 class I SAM-dependent methyltransferase [Neobacillus cucumis]
MKPLEKKRFKKIRIELLSKAKGYILEVGSGTGINFNLYNSVEKVVAIEPSSFMIERAQQRLNKSTIEIEIIQANAEKLPFADNTFDTVVATLVLCTIPNPQQALNEMVRVCKPDGKILFFEHVKMDNQFLAALQEWLTPAWKKICDGCCLNRDTLSLIKNYSLIINELNYYYKGLFIAVETIKPSPYLNS